MSNLEFRVLLKDTSTMQEQPGVEPLILQTTALPTEAELALLFYYAEMSYFV